MALYPGIYRATVAGSGDPMGQGRIQVVVPAVGGATLWALPCRPAGPQAIGRRAQDGLPATGATAWVMFEEGDPGRPVWLGVL